ncbi:periplasmic sensor diguanylate cyclase/phosphodiesterase [Vreelandella songnenensis]|uniref:cyclic-guanylate-specific phosphodiesterase n=1 Tax=Vreelandella songnenensis TaxID=1176243 RepID=A0A2T0V2Q5_9GAMM|nr:EAL domain-containing protein [Halomonas songnenensis]PRY64407.1 periplasmic sensor diguanylate cyclase/phosphodiesterase [Halomonas songnenensis]
MLAALDVTGGHRLPGRIFSHGRRLGGALKASLLLGSLCVTPSISANETLLVGVYHNPPKLFVDDQGKLRGVLGELLEAIAREEEWSLESIACDFQRCLELLERGDIDLMPDVAWSEERAERVAFHQEPIMHTWSQLYQHEGEGVEAILDLDQKRVAVVNGSIQQEYLRAVTERFDVMVAWQLVDSYAEGFQAVARGDADLAVSDHLFGDWRAHNYGLFETPIIFQPIRLFYAGSPMLSATVLERIDDVLRRWKQDPRSEYFTTLRAWRADAPPVGIIPAWLWWCLGLLAATCALALGFVLWLRRRMAFNRAQLKANEAMLATILDSVDAYIYIKTPALRYHYVNRRVSELFGLPPEQIVGKSDDAFFDSETAREVALVDRNVMESGKKVTIEESSVLQSDSHVRTFLTIKMPLVLSPGEPASLCGISTELTDFLEMQSRSNHLAFYDALTGLPNRRLLMESLAWEIEQESTARPYSALLVIDLDNFHLVNDIQGHESGDQLLINVAKHLHQHLPEGAVLARFSGDEFVALLAKLGEHQADTAIGAERAARQLLEAVSQLRTDYSLPVSASIGITLFDGVDHSMNSVLQQADLALQQAKAAGGNTLRFFNQDMQTSLIERANLEADLHHALARNELALHYQRQVDHQGVTVGVEALLRWYHPQRGWVSPATFISLAEENGLIVPIGYWVLQSACEQLAKWSNQAPYAALTISVNVSSVQFQQPEFVRNLEGLLAQTQAPPGRLVLEVTESLLMREPKRVRNTMLKLRAQGIRFAIDDFGTGYSSLSYLKRLPLDELKIDQSFVSELLTDRADAAIVDTTILLAVSLGLTVVAEGVEKKEQLDWLKGHGCYRYQGYLFGRPMPIENLFESY